MVEGCWARRHVSGEVYKSNVKILNTVVMSMKMSNGMYVDFVWKEFLSSGCKHFLPYCFCCSLVTLCCMEH